MHAVEIANVTKTFGNVTAVDDLSLVVPRGSIYGFIGPNGSGKTTTLRMIMNIFYPDTGSIRVFGEEAYGACTDRIGYLPEERGLYQEDEGAGGTEVLWRTQERGEGRSGGGRVAREAGSERLGRP